MPCSPAVVPLLTTRCLYWGWGHWLADGGVGGIRGYIWKMKAVYCKVLLKTPDSLLQTIEHELRSTGPKLVPLFVTGCLSLGGIEGACRDDGWGHSWQNSSLTHRLMTCHADLQVVPLLNTRCLYWGGGVRGALVAYIWKIETVYCKVLLKTQDSLLQTIEHELRSMGPKIVPLLATRCLSLGACGGGGTSDKRAAWPTGWWHVMLTCSSTTLDH